VLVISGSRARCLFFVELGASIRVASTSVPSQQDAPFAQVGVHRLEDRTGQLVPLQHVAEGEDRRLVRDRVIAQLQPRKPAHPSLS
jgi:hypothetical protein